MLSQFFVLSPRGDTIVVRDFRGSGVKGAADVFFRRIKSETKAYHPILFVDDLCFVYMKRSGLYFVLTTEQVDAPASLWVEILDSVVRVIKDFCGTLSENTVRRNFTLVYELIDEIFDYGYPQALQTGELTNVVRNEPAVETVPSQLSTISLTSLSSAGLSQLSSIAGNTAGKLRNTSSAALTVPSNASQTPISYFNQVAGGGKTGFTSNDIFIDILDRLSVEILTSGIVKRYEIEGLILIKSYMPESQSLKLGLNEDLVINSAAGPKAYFDKGLDDCLFHECVNLQEFESSKTLQFTPPQGEFTLMKYRANHLHLSKPPVHVHPTIRIINKEKIELSVRLETDQKSLAGVASMTVHIPPWISGGCAETTQQFQVVEIQKNAVVWSTRKLGPNPGGFKARLSVDPTQAPAGFINVMNNHSLPVSGNGISAEQYIAKYFGPISLQFDLPMCSSANVQVSKTPESQCHNRSDS